MIRTLVLLSLVASISYGISNRLSYHRAIKTVEQYSGETYSQGDCDLKDIYEADDEAVVKACSELEQL